MNRFRKQNQDDLEECTNKTFGYLILVAILMFIMSLCVPQQCRAQSVQSCDTIALPTRNLVDVVKKTSKTGKPVFYAIYAYEGVEDVTAISKSVVDYIEICKECNIQPKLALRIKNGEVVAVIRQKKGSHAKK